MMHIKTNWLKLLNAFRIRMDLYYKKTIGANSFIQNSWRMILYVSGLAILMIYSSHKVDVKVVEISRLNESLKDLRSRHIDMRTELTSISKVTKVSKGVEQLGLFIPMDSPFKIEKED